MKDEGILVNLFPTCWRRGWIDHETFLAGWERGFAVEFMDPMTFYESVGDGMFYVGFMKSAETWFPFALVSDPEGGAHCLDTLCLSQTYQGMEVVLKKYAAEIPQVKHTFVQFLMKDEISNLLARYSLEKVVLLTSDGCGCGCP